MNFRIIAILLSLPVAPAVFSAQGTQPPPKPTTPMGPAPTRAPASPDAKRDWDKVLTGGRSGDNLSGNVAIAGGTLPWDPIPVNVMCDGKTRFTTVTDRKGNFTIAFAESAGSTTINSDPKPVAVQFVGCSVEARLAGFDSTSLPIATRNVLDSSSLGTITLHREAGPEGAALSETTAGAPKDALKSFDKARAEAMENKPDRATRELQKAVELYPGFAEAWFQLGKLQAAANSPDAWNSFSKAAAADLKFALPYEHMAPLAAQSGKWQDLLNVTNSALARNPRGNLELWYYHAYANFQLQKLDVAESSANKSLAMDPLHVELNTEQLLAVILAQKGEVPAAIQHLTNCLSYFPPGPKLDLVKQQLAQMQQDSASRK